MPENQNQKFNLKNCLGFTRTGHGFIFAAGGPETPASEKPKEETPKKSETVLDSKFDNEYFSEQKDRTFYVLRWL